MKGGENEMQMGKKKSNGYREKEGKGDKAETLLIIYRTIFLKVTYKTKGKANQELT